MFPEAKFVFNKRDHDLWGESMAKFMTEFRDIWLQSEYLFQLTGGAITPFPTDTFFKMFYGDYYILYTAEEWAHFSRVYEAHIREFFRSETASKSSLQMIELDFTRGSLEIWKKLADFIGFEAPTDSRTPFPKADVWSLTFTTQPKAMLSNLFCHMMGPYSPVISDFFQRISSFSPFSK
jgi:hypothetical protein